MKTVNVVEGGNGSNGALKAPKLTKKQKVFKFQVEYCPNTDIVMIHTKKKFPLAETDRLMMAFNKAERNKEGQGNKHPLIASIRRTKGVLKVSSKQFQLRIEKAKLFSWDEILPKVQRALKEHFADGLELEETPAQRPSEDYLAALRQRGCDV